MEYELGVVDIQPGLFFGFTDDGIGHLFADIDMSTGDNALVVEFVRAHEQKFPFGVEDQCADGGGR